jgi:hypothetical protein
MQLRVIQQQPVRTKRTAATTTRAIPDKDESEPVVATKRSRQPFDLQLSSRIKGCGGCHREQKQVELHDDKPEGHQGYAGAHPCEERPLIGGMVFAHGS